MIDPEKIAAERNQPWREDLRKSVRQAERTRRDRLPMPEQEAKARSRNYLEVNEGLTPEMAEAEAQRCLDCVTPTCIEGCPVNINIPKFIKKIESKDYLGAARVLKETNTLPSVCGRVCPQEIQCEAKCFYTLKLNKPAVGIGNLERFAADFERNSGNISIPEMAQKMASK